MESRKSDGKAREIPPPLLLSVIVCKTIITDKRTRRASIINIVWSVGARRFPAACPPLKLYFELTDGHGLIKIFAQIVDMKDEKVLDHTEEYELNFKDPRQVITVILPIRKVVFPHAGEYRFEIYKNGPRKILLGQRRIVCKELKLEEESNNVP